MSRQAGSMFGGFQSRAGYPSKRAGSRCGCVLRARPKVKLPGTEGEGSVRTCRNRIGQNQGLNLQELGWQELGWQELGWQEWQSYHSAATSTGATGFWPAQTPRKPL